MIEIDLHGYYPRTVQDSDLIAKLVEQAWQAGAAEVRFIHGHGRSRGNPRPFANTNTGLLGLTVRSRLRNGADLRRWIYTRIDVSHRGSTVVRLRPNPSPTRKEIDRNVFPDLDFWE
jgi:hypothetical protein